VPPAFAQRFFDHATLDGFDDFVDRLSVVKELFSRLIVSTGSTERSNCSSAIVFLF
jgi:hypothetical protein